MRLDPSGYYVSEDGRRLTREQLKAEIDSRLAKERIREDREYERWLTKGAETLPEWITDDDRWQVADAAELEAIFGPAIECAARDCFETFRPETLAEASRSHRLRRFCSERCYEREYGRIRRALLSDEEREQLRAESRERMRELRAQRAVEAA